MSDSFQKGFTRYERNGILLLCMIILVSIIAKKYVLQYFMQEHYLTEADKQKIAQIKKQINEAKNDDGVSNYATSNSYVNYTPKNFSTSDRNNYDFKIEVNSATAEEYEKLYGVGKVLSQRIIEFRNHLGGFYAVEQIKDVYGIEDSVFENFKKNLTIHPVLVKKININEASFEELTSNPYFFSTLAKQIIGFRIKVHAYETIDDVKSLYYIRDHPEAFDKIAPYIKLN